MKLVSFLIYAMLLPDKETIFSHDFLELSKNAFIEKRKKTDSNFVNSAKVGAYGEVPLDNNATESTLRGFCIGKHNWWLIDTIRGAKSSAIIYSITETAKANGLKVYEYVEYLLTEIPKHEDDTDLSFLDDLLPWPPNLPEYCRKSNKFEVK